MRRDQAGAATLLCSLVAIVAGCFNPAYHSSGLRCEGNGGKCPSGYHCATDKRCWHDGSDPVAAGNRDMSASDGMSTGDGMIGPDMAHIGTGAGKLGDACINNSDCALGHCADSVCCDGPCGACATCNSSGHCVPVVKGMDPHGACTNVVCANGCDGAGACAAASATTVCKASCQNQVSPSDQSVCTVAQCGNTLLTPTLCNGSATGNAACSVVNGAHACANSLICDGTTACKMSCLRDADCIAGTYCNQGTCTAKINNGVSCSRDGQCNSNACSTVSGKCVSCKSSFDCSAFGAVCDTASGNCRSCTVDTDCHGWGPTCNTANSACVCGGTIFDCTSPSNPFCMPGGAGPPVCGCGTQSISLPNVVCSVAGDNTGKPVKVAGQPCLSGAECASNMCNNNVCAKAPKGTLCRGPDDCVSGNCTSSNPINHGAFSCS
jgi:hypothetical protein